MDGDRVGGRGVSSGGFKEIRSDRSERFSREGEREGESQKGISGKDGEEGDGRNKEENFEVKRDG